ncbi:MAG: dihydropteroate synthase [Deltaproteobacteria bacterium]|jgi:dihydropteroate synthase|nr:dihydropteroate synthase [Deltaproteobacteria bacterium]
MRLELGSKVLVMGILNVTPDSFSDGGRFFSSSSIAAQVETLVESGADIIDVGGESTRPFAEPVSIEEESARVLPAIRTIRQRYSIPVSIDTTKAEVARKALEEGADIINDISALRFDQAMIGLVRETEVPVIIMHMQGTPSDMQVDPHYDDVVTEIKDFFRERMAWAADNGVPQSRFIIDPGIGFGKTVGHNLSILKRIEEFFDLGRPVLIGHSRKSFIGKLLNTEVDERDVASAAVSAICAMKGASILRVHDVAKTVEAVRLAEAINRAE